MMQLDGQCSSTGLLPRCKPSRTARIVARRTGGTATRVAHIEAVGQADGPDYDEWRRFLLPPSVPPASPRRPKPSAQAPAGEAQTPIQAPWDAQQLIQLAHVLHVGLPVVRCLAGRQPELLATHGMEKLVQQLQQLRSCMELHMTQVVNMVSRQPALLSCVPGALAAQLRSMAAALGLNGPLLASLVARQPELLEVPPGRLLVRAAQLTDLLMLQPADVDAATAAAAAAVAVAAVMGSAEADQGHSAGSREQHQSAAAEKPVAVRVIGSHQQHAQQNMPSRQVTGGNGHGDWDFLLQDPEGDLQLEMEAGTALREWLPLVQKGKPAASNRMPSASPSADRNPEVQPTVNHVADGSDEGFQDSAPADTLAGSAYSRPHLIRRAHELTRPVHIPPGQANSPQRLVPGSGLSSRAGSRTAAAASSVPHPPTTPGHVLAGLHVLARLPSYHFYELLALPARTIAQRLLALEAALGLGTPAAAGAMMARCPQLLTQPLRVTMGAWEVLLAGPLEGVAAGKRVDWLARCPSLLCVPAQELTEGYATLQSELGLLPAVASKRVLQQPSLMKWGREGLAAKLQETAVALGVDEGVVRRMVRGAPGVLAHSAVALAGKKAEIQRLLQLDSHEVSKLLSEQPSLFTNSSATLERKLLQLGATLQLPRPPLLQLLRAAPTLLTCNPQSLVAKMHALQELLGWGQEEALDAVQIWPSLLIVPTGHARGVLQEVRLRLGIQQGNATESRSEQPGDRQTHTRPRVRVPMARDRGRHAEHTEGPQGQGGVVGTRVEQVDVLARVAAAWPELVAGRLTSEQVAGGVRILADRLAMAQSRRAVQGRSQRDTMELGMQRGSHTADAGDSDAQGEPLSTATGGQAPVQQAAEHQSPMPLSCSGSGSSGVDGEAVELTVRRGVDEQQCEYSQGLEDEAHGPRDGTGMGRVWPPGSRGGAAGVDGTTERVWVDRALWLAAQRPEVLKAAVQKHIATQRQRIPRPPRKGA